ncbi:prepilin-type N-terminal cleavage/methylation domain-containing protein [Thiohalocapsa marina]|uniref:Prepilin-type N-terminal cleavage/methylation domain-containing protein n=1 Tax=Thiohalocapsa marina TaxID=424902 RepID=A0A5M8FMC6_9GAMM|nr:pilin [Thiohalocapsa marina]KAA6184866.1 prepilin-type N-terminal cleavage/methylation domain-containing protein [Thiohalocapsa marina]
MKRHNQAGFTLIELMIVVAIIGILAAIAIPAYQDYVARSQMSEAMMLTGGAKTAVAEYWMQTGSFPTDNADAGLSNTISGSYVASVTVGASGIVATMNNSVSTPIQGATLTLTPTSTGGSITWECSSDADAKYLPAACR